MTAPDLLLLPRPRQVELGPPACDRHAVPAVAVDPTLPAEGYTLVVDEGGVRITHADEPGRRYALAILDQLRDQSTDRLPGARIADHPDLAVRGVMLDVSRDRVPTRATLERLVQVMAVARLNHLQLYIEHTFAYRDHEVVWQDASPLDADDLRWLDDRCAAHGIELAVNQNCFGHMGRWLAHEQYRWRAELPDGLELAPGLVLPPTTLAPSPENAAFALGLVEEMAAAVRSRTVNIGCDETFELGQGASRAAVADRGPAAVWAEHVARIARPLADAGHHVQFWDDVARHEPGVLALLPDDAVALAWWYEAPGASMPAAALDPEVRALIARIGIDLDAMARWSAGFTAVTEGIASSGRSFWVCPGTSTWNSFVGRTDNARANLLDAAVVGRDRGAGGYLITDWGDNGHHQPPSVSFGPILYGGAVSWCADANADVDVAGALDRFVFDDDAEVLGGLLDGVGRLWTRTGEVSFNSSPLATAVLSGMFLPGVGQPHPVRANAVAGALDDALAALRRARPACADGDDVVAELEAAVRLARHGARRLAARGGGAAADPAWLARDFDGAVEAHRAAWLRRSRPGGLDDSVAHLRPPT